LNAETIDDDLTDQYSPFLHPRKKLLNCSEIRTLILPLAKALTLDTHGHVKQKISVSNKKKQHPKLKHHIKQ